MRFGKLKPPSGGGANFLKIEPGSKVRGLLVGEPIEFYKDYKGESKWKFRVNFVMQENGAHVAKILEQGSSVYKQIVSLEEEGWDFGKNLVIISRVGAGKETRYTVAPDPKGALNEKQLAQIAQVPLQDLTPREPSDSQEPPTEEAPF